MTESLHEHFQQMIDESLLGSLLPDREQMLREHLTTCPACQAYLGASKRVIAGLGGFSFAVDQSLTARVVASLPATHGEGAPQRRSRWVLISVTAVVLTLSGSFFDLQLGGLLASVSRMQRMQVQQELLTFWIVPSMIVFLLFPLLPLLSNAGTRREERTL